MLLNLHWTPLHIALKASRFLAPDPSYEVLDIGYGVGKFCFIGAASTGGKFTGAVAGDHPDQQDTFPEAVGSAEEFHISILPIHNLLLPLDGKV
jgi:hypothetical protein